MPNPQTSLARPTAHTRLLIVDDDASTRTSLSHIFTELGYQVRAAENGLAALRLLREETTDILLSDLNMPRMSGFELLSIVRRRFPSVYVVAMSGAYSGKMVPQAIAADAFYEKASNAASLFQMVASVSKAERLAMEQTGEKAPMWVPSNGHNLSGKPYVTLACPECMRTFPHVLEETGFFVKQTACEHCAAPIHFAVVTPDGIQLEHAPPRKPVMEPAREMQSTCGT
jgi:CheY-like chemotaxis protein